MLKSGGGGGGGESLISPFFRLIDHREKSRLKKEFACFESSSQLFQLIYCVNCWRTLLELNSYHKQVQKEEENFVVGCLPLT